MNKTKTKQTNKDEEEDTLLMITAIIMMMITINVVMIKTKRTNEVDAFEKSDVRPFEPITFSNTCPCPTSHDTNTLEYRRCSARTGDKDAGQNHRHD